MTKMGVWRKWGCGETGVLVRSDATAATHCTGVWNDERSKCADGE